MSNVNESPRTALRRRVRDHLVKVATRPVPRTTTSAALGMLGIALVLVAVAFEGLTANSGDVPALVVSIMASALVTEAVHALWHNRNRGES